MSLTPEKMKSCLKGPLALLPTHFNNDGSLDIEAMKTTALCTKRTIQGRDGCIMIAGSTSEFYAMTDDESEKMIEAVVTAINGELPVICGTGRAATGLSLTMSKRAESLGIDCAMITNPYYMHVSEEGLYRHFSQIAESLSIGLMIYDNPTTSKIAIPVNLMQRLSKITNIVGVKENTTNIEHYYNLTNAVDPADMEITCGIGQLMFLFEAPLGCRAYVTELVCFAPEFAYGIYDASKAKDFVLMKSWLERLKPYHQFVASCVARRNIPSILGQEWGGKATAVYQSILKKAMEFKGLPGGIVREPLENITDEETKELKKVLQLIGIV